MAASMVTLASSFCGAAVQQSLRPTPGSISSDFGFHSAEARVVCKKEGIHPKYYPTAKVYCNGEMVMTTSGTQPEYVVDVWSGNHPFFQGSKNTLITEAGRVDKFNQRYGNMGSMSKIPVLTKGEIIIPKKTKPNQKGKGKK
eukprot:TRINITY_DN358_c0_g1_i2.p1 TRINITY_DN358_c0_g1~~TRINITY_DN358_c0_g1_i2.p1  ORF type:complete len:142 (-),score=29.24 TRINITY_DN358_c0_g1_i2:288-713(-)